LTGGGTIVPIDIAYGGTCTGGKRTDMDLYAAVLSRAVDAGLRVSPGVRFFIQFGSHDVRRYAEERGYLRIFERAGATLLDPPTKSRSAPEAEITRAEAALGGYTCRVHWWSRPLPWRAG
jgi:hypothetical protein